MWGHQLNDKLADIFPGTSVMAETMRARGWVDTPLGPPQQWPDALKIPLRMLLTSRFEMWLGWGPDLRFFYNDAYIPTLGIKHPDALGKPFREVWSEVYEDVADQVERVRSGEATWNKALLLLLERSGYPEETYHSFSYSPLFLPNGEVGGLLCVVTEETARVISERRLETLRHLGTSLATATDKAAIKSAVNSVFAANQCDFPFVALHLAGDEQPDDWEKIFPDAAGRSMDSFSQSGEVVQLMPDIDWPCGAWDRPPSKAVAIAVPGLGEGAVAGLLVLALNPYRVEDEDILNVVQLIAGQIGSALANVVALDNERRRADRLWSVSRDLMLVIDAKGIFRSVSPSWTRILGHPVEEVVGQHFSGFMHPEEVEESEAALRHALHDQELSNYANRLRAIDGSYHLIEWHTTMEDGLVYAYGRDVTERDEAQRQLERARDALFQSQKMEAIGQLTGGVAHDFNNLLMAIMSSLDLLRKRLPPDPLAQRLLVNAVEGAQRGATLTQRMLAFARRQELHLDSVDVAQLLAGMNDLVQRSIGPEWPITTNFPLRLPAVRADANQLEMALLNLIVNARDASPLGGSIVILASAETIAGSSGSGLQPGNYVRIVVRDQGTGMDRETMRRATEPFFTTKGVGKGTGLGLPMVHGMAQQLGGTFELVSEMGKGTSAILWLPAVEHHMVPLQSRSCRGDAGRERMPTDGPRGGRRRARPDEHRRTPGRPRA